MRNISRLDFFLKHIFLLTLPLLLFSTASLVSFLSTNNTLSALYSGLCGLAIGCVITVFARKFFILTLFEIPHSLLLFTYLIFVFFFYILLQGNTVLLLIPGFLAGLYFRRASSFSSKIADEYDFKVFQISLITAVTIGVASLITSLLVFLNITSLTGPKQLKMLLDTFPGSIDAIILITGCALISLIQFLITKTTMLFKRN